MYVPPSAHLEWQNLNLTILLCKLFIVLNIGCSLQTFPCILACQCGLSLKKKNLSSHLYRKAVGVLKCHGLLLIDDFIHTGCGMNFHKRCAYRIPNNCERVCIWSLLCPLSCTAMCRLFSFKGHSDHLCFKCASQRCCCSLRLCTCGIALQLALHGQLYPCRRSSWRSVFESQSMRPLLLKWELTTTFMFACTSKWSASLLLADSSCPCIRGQTTLSFVLTKGQVVQHFARITAQCTLNF